LIESERVVMFIHLRHGRRDIYTLTSPTNCQKSLADIVQICPSGSQVARSPGCIVLLPMFHDRRQHAVSRTVYLSLNLARVHETKALETFFEFPECCRPRCIDYHVL
jgi:hypothetical protein